MKENGISKKYKKLATKTLRHEGKINVLCLCSGVLIKKSFKPLIALSTLN